MLEEIRCRIHTGEADQTIERYLRSELLLTKAQIRSLKYQKEGIRLNGERTRVTGLLKEGDVLAVSLHSETEDGNKIVPVEHDLKILYEDRDVIAVWKDAGIPVHPAGRHYQDSLMNYLAWYYQSAQKSVPLHAIGRLDLGTSGIMVYAKHRLAAAKLWKQKQKGQFYKEYEAICEGVFPPEAYEDDQKITFRLKNKDPYMMQICEDGKDAETTYRAIRRSDGECDEGTSFVRVWIRTGRMHQIRVHMAAIGHPLVGDPLYGHGKVQGGYAELSAVKVVFFQPFTGVRIELDRSSCI